MSTDKSGVDSQVWTAARNLNDAQRKQPVWLWRDHETGQTTFGRWQNTADQAPYVRADLLSALAPQPQVEAEPVAWRYRYTTGKDGDGDAFWSRWVLMDRAALEAVAAMPSGEAGAKPVRAVVGHIPPSDANVSHAIVLLSEPSSREVREKDRIAELEQMVTDVRQQALEDVASLTMRAEAAEADGRTYKGLLDLARQDARDWQRKALASLRPSAASAPAVAKLVDAARELLDTLRPEETAPFRDPKYGDAVEALGEKIGYGALMSSASASWYAKDPIGAFVAGPCFGILTKDMARLREALAAFPEQKDKP